MNRVKTSLKPKMIRSLVCLVLAVFVLLVHAPQSATGTIYYSASKQNRTALDSPPVILQSGTAGNSTIYLNGTSARVSVRAAYGYNDSSNYNHVLRMTENHGTNWKVRLRTYDQSNIERLNNCSIFIYNGSNSTQITISNGSYSQQTGPWYDLTASDTEFIWMHVEASSTGTSCVYVYLEILVPSITTYAQHIVTFVIT